MFSQTITVKRLKNGDEEKLESFLSSYAETSMFLRSNLLRAGLEYCEQDYHGEYLGAFNEEGKLSGVLAHYWNGNIMMQAVDVTVLSDLVASFRKVVLRPVAGILGANDQAMTVIQELDLIDTPYIINRNEGFYALSLDALCLPLSFDPDCHAMVEASKVNREVLIKWTKAYEIEALGASDDEKLNEHAEKRVERMIKEDCWVLLVDGKPVSLSGFNARLPDIVQIGPVWTPTEYRSRGYARTLVALTLQQAKKHGAQKAILFTDNPAAVKAYEAIGFRKRGSYRLALLKNPIKLEIKP